MVEVTPDQATGKLRRMFPVKIGFRDNVTCVTLDGKVLRGHGVHSCKIHDGCAVHRMEEMRGGGVDKKQRNKQKESRARHTENNDKRKIRRNGRYTLFPNAACMT